MRLKLIALALCLGSVPAIAGILPLLNAGPGTPSAGGPRIIPGVAFGGATAQPANIGGNTDNTIAVWDMVPYQTYASTFQVCVAAFHNQGITKVSFAADGGSFVDVLTTTANPVTSAQEYCATAGGASWTDGPHEFRAIAYPVSGVPRVLSNVVNVASTTVATPAVFTVPAHPYEPRKAIVISGSTLTGITNGTIYYISTTNFTGSTFSLATTQGGATLVNTSGTQTGQMVISAGGQSTEQEITNGGSMTEVTDANGGAGLSFVVDNSATGCGGGGCSNSNDCLTTATACSSIYGPIVKTGQTNASITSFTTTNLSPIVVNKVAHGLVVGQGFQFTGSGTPPPPSAKGVVYYVVAGGFSSSAFEFAATRGGTALVSNGTGKVGTVTYSSDMGGITISLQTGAGAGYAYGDATETNTYGAAYEWLNIVAGAAQSPVITSDGNASGLKVTKVHLKNVGVTGANLITNNINANSFGGSSVWLEGVTASGGVNGHTVNNSSIIGNRTGWPGGAYLTGGTGTEQFNVAGNMTLVQNYSVLNTGAIAYNQSAIVVNSSATNVGLDQNTTGFHPDFIFSFMNSSSIIGSNQVYYNVTCTVSCAGEGWFTQSQSFPGFFDQAIVGSTITVDNATYGTGFTAVLLEYINGNILSLNNTFSSGAFGSGANALVATSVIFQSTTCGTKITPTGGYSGVTFTSSSTCGP